MPKENHVIKEKIQERNPKYCHQNNLNITYKTGKEISDIFNISRYNDIFIFMKKMESNIKDKLPINVELNFITLEALKIYKDENGDFSKLDKILGNNIFYLLNDISMYNISKPVTIVDEYLNDSTIEKLNDFYSNNFDIVLVANKKNCSTLYIFDILNRNENYYLLNNIYNAIKEKNSLKKSIASQLIFDFETQENNNISQKGKEELCYKISIINKKFDSINFDDLKNINISVDNIFDYIN